MKILKIAILLISLLTIIVSCNRVENTECVTCTEKSTGYVTEHCGTESNVKDFIYNLENGYDSVKLRLTVVTSDSVYIDQYIYDIIKSYIDTIHVDSLSDGLDEITIDLMKLAEVINVLDTSGNVTEVLKVDINNIQWTEEWVQVIDTNSGRNDILANDYLLDGLLQTTLDYYGNDTLKIDTADIAAYDTTYVSYFKRDSLYKDTTFIYYVILNDSLFDADSNFTGFELEQIYIDSSEIATDDIVGSEYDRWFGQNWECDSD